MLERAGKSIREISRLSGHSRNTVRKVVRGEHTLKREEPVRESKLDEHKQYVKDRYEDYELSAVRLIEEIRPMGYEGSLSTLRRYLRTLKTDTTRKKKLTVRFETPPGKQAQADWGYCGKFDTPSGCTISVYVFVIVLSFSRQLFIHFTTSMRMPELIRCHQLAFEFFGGWPETILYDNMKQVKLSRQKWNEQFMDFANHYGFVPKTHRPYRPRTKGKVERQVDYVKNNFLRGRTFEGIDELNARGIHWLENTANVRVHATTKERPCDLMQKETLTPVSSTVVYNFVDPVKRLVSWESTVRFEGSRYSVPPKFAGKTVEVAAQGAFIAVRLGDTVIAEHRQATKAGQSVVDKEHVAELWRLTHEQLPQTGGKKWEIRFAQSVQAASLSAKVLR